MIETMKGKLTSRKWWAAVIGSVSAVLIGYLSDEVQLWESIQAASVILISYLFAQGAVDYSAARG